MAKVYQAIAGSFDAMGRARDEWIERHESRILAIVKEHMPSGSGFDCGTAFDFDKSKRDKLIFTTQFHHTDANGYYQGWSEHTITVRPSLIGEFALSVSGRDKNGIKEYIGDCFYYALNSDCEILA